jgi:hypothetical protein
MTVQHSFSKIEKELLPAFRQQIGTAESTEDVKKNFVYTTSDLLDKATGGELKPRYEDIRLAPEAVDDNSKFNFSGRIMDNPAFMAVWRDSDLQHIVGRFAVSACNRYKHLEKNPDRTEIKIHM